MTISQRHLDLPVQPFIHLERSIWLPTPTNFELQLVKYLYTQLRFAEPIDFDFGRILPKLDKIYAFEYFMFRISLVVICSQISGSSSFVDIVE